MTPQAWMLGELGRMRFVGHFRFAAEQGATGVTVAGRVAHGDGVAGAFEPARSVERALRGTHAVDRQGWLHAIFVSIAQVPRTDLGSRRGADLSLLAVAWDAGGVSATGVGLSGVWGVRAQVIDELPLSCFGGNISDGDQKAQVIPVDCGVVLGAPAPADPVLPDLSQLALRCGVNR